MHHTGTRFWTLGRTFYADMRILLLFLLLCNQIQRAHSFSQSASFAHSSTASGSQVPVKSAIVVGGGIGGLAAGLALHRKGLSVKILERAPVFVSTAGAGFGFSPNGQLVLSALGISREKIRERTRAVTRTLLVDGNGKVLTDNRNYAELEPSFGFPFGGALRAKIVDILAAPLSEEGILYHGVQVADVQQDATHVEVILTNGTVLNADILIGADGIASKVAQCILDDVKNPTYSGENIFYGVIEDASLSNPGAFNNPHLGHQDTMLLIFEKGEFVSFYCGDGDPDHPCHTLIWALTYRSNTPPDRAEWASDDKVKAELQRVVSRLSPNHPVHELIGKTPGDRLTHFGMFYREFKKKWHVGRCVLLGDSAHATLPYVGQGANQALEDAYVLADCLEACQYQYTSAFEAYYDRRAKRTKRFVDLSTTLGRIYHVENFFLSWARDRLMTFVLGSRSTFEAAKKEILYDCPVPYQKYLPMDHPDRL